MPHLHVMEEGGGRLHRGAAEGDVPPESGAQRVDDPQLAVRDAADHEGHYPLALYLGTDPGL